MLCARLTRVTPGRPEADLAVVTMTMRSKDQPDTFDCRIATGMPDDYLEQAVVVTAWPVSPRPPVLDLLAHVINLARAERTISEAGLNAPAGTTTAVMPYEVAVELADIARAWIDETGARLTRDAAAAIDELRAE